MKFICTQENLLQGLSQCSPIAGRNVQLPILQHALLKAEGNVLHITTTDLEVGVHASIGGKMEREGGCAVPARSFFDYVQQLPKSHPIVLESKKGGLLVSTKGFRAQFPVSDPDEYPLLPKGGDGVSVDVKSLVLCHAMSGALFAAAREETRPEIRSVFVQADKKELRVAATDSFRLVEDVVPLEAKASFSFILPLASAQEVVRLFGGSDTVTVTAHDNYAIFQRDGLELSSRLVDGVYPDYKQIIPTSHKTSISVSSDEFLRAMKTLAVFLPRDSRRVQLDINPKSGKMLAKVAGGESGQGDVSLSVDGDGEEVGVLLSIQYLLEGIQHISGDECVVELSGSQDPVVFRPTGAESKYVYVVMPIQAQ